jgi:hypothetical protein
MREWKRVFGALLAKRISQFVIMSILLVLDSGCISDPARFGRRMQAMNLTRRADPDDEKGKGTRLSVLIAMLL